MSSARVTGSEYRALLAEGIDPKVHRNEHLKAKKTVAANTLKKVTTDWLCAKKSKEDAKRKRTCEVLIATSATVNRRRKH